MRQRQAEARASVRETLQGHLAHKKTPTALGPPWDPTHMPTVGSWGGWFLVSETLYEAEACGVRGRKREKPCRDRAEPKSSFTEATLSPDPVDSYTMPLAPMPSQWLERVSSPQRTILWKRHNLASVGALRAQIPTTRQRQAEASASKRERPCRDRASPKSFCSSGAVLSLRTTA